MLIGILKETAPGETRVALLPESLKSLRAQGIDVTVETGAGIPSGASDQAYADAGATITVERSTVLGTADLLPTVNALDAADQALKANDLSAAMMTALYPATVAIEERASMD